MPDVDDRPVVGRTAALGLTALVVVPALLLYGYLLLWFLPEATGYSCAPDDFACHRDPADTVYWWLLLTAVLVAAVALALAWHRRWHPAPWWPWPTVALSAVTVGAAVSTLLT